VEADHRKMFKLPSTLKIFRNLISGAS